MCFYAWVFSALHFSLCLDHLSRIFFLPKNSFFLSQVSVPLIILATICSSCMFLFSCEITRWLNVKRYSMFWSSDFTIRTKKGFGNLFWVLGSYQIAKYLWIVVIQIILFQVKLQLSARFVNGEAEVRLIKIHRQG